MCPPLIAVAVVAALAAAAGITAKAIGDANARGDYAEAMRLRREAVAKYGDVILPKIDKILVKSIGPTELSKMQESTEGRDAQMAALQKYRDVIAGGGMDAQSRLAFMQAQSEAGRLNSGMQGQIQQQMAQRGLAGSGYEWAGREQAAQNASQRAAQMQAQAAADASQRSLSAVGQYAALGSILQQQDYGKARDRAAAQDAINRWNAENETSTQKYNNSIAQNQFDNTLNLRNAQANASLGLATAYTGEAQRAERDANAYGQMTQQGINSVGGAVAKGM